MTPHFEDPIQYNITIQNNSDFSEAWAFLDKKTQTSILETTYTYILTIKNSPDINAVALLTLGNETATTVSGILPDNDVDTNGLLTVTMFASDVENLISSGLVEQVLYYDLKVIYPDTLEVILLIGTITLNMGIGQ